MTDDTPTYRRVTTKWCNKHSHMPLRWWQRPFRRWLRRYNGPGQPLCPCPSTIVDVWDIQSGYREGLWGP